MRPKCSCGAFYPRYRNDIGVCPEEVHYRNDPSHRFYKKKGFRYYIKRAKAKAIESWHLTLLAGFAFFEATWAIIEFILHVLRIPHWH
jgi:hypothetical protein